MFLLISTGIAPDIPPKVQIVVLKRNTVNPLISKTYDAQPFERVEV
jgi:hypothetical protein